MTANLWHVSYFIGLHTRNRIVHLLCSYHVFIAISIGFTKASFLGGDLFFIGTIGTDLPTQGRNGGGRWGRAPPPVFHTSLRRRKIFSLILKPCIISSFLYLPFIQYYNRTKLPCLGINIHSGSSEEYVSVPSCPIRAKLYYIDFWSKVLDMLNNDGMLVS